MSEEFLKDFGDRIAEATNTNLCERHRLHVARQLIHWLAEREPTPAMINQAGAALGKEVYAGNFNLTDHFLAQYRAALMAIVT